MGKKDATSRIVKGNNTTKQPYSNQESQLFFNTRQITPSPEVQRTPLRQEAQQPVPEIRLQTTTDILLAAILQELRTQNLIELSKLQDQQEKEQEELQAAKEMQERDNARFEEIRQSMYL